MNALDLILTTQWAMSREPLELMLQIVRQRESGERVSRLLDTGPRVSAEGDTDSRPDWCTWAEKAREYESVLLQGGSRLEGARRAILRDGVAVVPLIGPVFRRSNLMTDLSGAQSLELFARDLAVAVANPDVKAILLDIDSPGGQAAGIAETAAHIVAMNRKKPVCAYVGGTGASAAYWLAVACGSITLSPTAIVGSIGVLGAYQRDSRDEVTIVSSQSPNKKPDLDTEEGRAEIQRVIDDLAAVFVSDVARYRAVSEATVLSDFGAGGVLVGRKAVAAGMADRVGNLEATLKALASDPHGLPGRRKRAEADGDVSAEDDLQVQGAAPAAKPFEDELLALLAGAQGSIDRAREIHSKRAEEGRTLSQARRQQLEQVRDAFTALLDETRPRASEADRLRLAAQAQAIEAEALKTTVCALLGG